MNHRILTLLRNFIYKQLYEILYLLWLYRDQIDFGNDLPGFSRLRKFVIRVILRRIKPIHLQDDEVDKVLINLASEIFLTLSKLYAKNSVNELSNDGFSAFATS